MGSSGTWENRGNLVCRNGEGMGLQDGVPDLPFSAVVPLTAMNVNCMVSHSLLEQSSDKTSISLPIKLQGASCSRAGEDGHPSSRREREISPFHSTFVLLGSTVGWMVPTLRRAGLYPVNWFKCSPLLETPSQMYPETTFISYLGIRTPGKWTHKMSLHSEL